MFLFLCRFKFFEGFGADAVLSILLRRNSFSSAIPRPHTVIAAKPSLVWIIKGSLKQVHVCWCESINLELELDFLCTVEVLRKIWAQVYGKESVFCFYLTNVYCAARQNAVSTNEQCWFRLVPAFGNASSSNAEFFKKKGRGLRQAPMIPCNSPIQEVLRSLWSLYLKHSMVAFSFYVILTKASLSLLL